MKSKEKYKKIKKLGKGSFGKVYLVECPKTMKQFAIKTINLSALKEDEINNTLQEAKLMPNLNHPNIIHFEESFLLKNPKPCLCLVMEYAEGDDMFKRIKNQIKNKTFFSENQILDWLTQICLGIKFLHDRKILHRDLKTENIFLTKNQIIKLGDFGVAKCLDYTLEKASSHVGSPYYISPEILNGEEYSYPTDVWSLGVILYELCCLKKPFEGRNIGELNANIIRGKYIDIKTDYSKDLKCLVNNLLNKNQEQRMRINDILRLKIINDRIKTFLSEVKYNDELSHTIIHKYNHLSISQKESNKETTPNLEANNQIHPKNSANIEEEKESIKENKDLVINHKMYVEMNEIKSQGEKNLSNEDEQKLFWGDLDSKDNKPLSLEELQVELEALLGKDLLFDVFKVLDEIVPKEKVIFVKENITSILLEKYNNIEMKLKNIIISKVAEIFSIVVDKRINKEIFSMRVKK